MALLIMISGCRPLSAADRKISQIAIPVSARRQLTGLPTGRHGRAASNFYERALPTPVNDIEHIESQSISDYGIIKIFFQPT